MTLTGLLTVVAEPLRPPSALTHTAVYCRTGEPPSLVGGLKLTVTAPTDGTDPVTAGPEGRVAVGTTTVAP